MSIYAKPVTALMREMVQELPIAKGQDITKREILSWFHAKYPRIKDGTVAANLILLSTNAPSRVHHNAKESDDLFFQIDGGTFRLFSPATDPAPIYKTVPGTPPSLEADAGEDEESADREFAYESDLRGLLG